LPPPVDYFAVLQQPRRPWVEAEQLKEKHQQLTLALHPDRSGRDTMKINPDVFPYSFARITEAYRVLSDPKQRLGHLLTLEGATLNSTGSPPNELIELFTIIGAFVQETDVLLEKAAGAKSALAKSLLQPQILDTRQRACELLKNLEALSNSALDELRQLDDLWDEQREEAVATLKDLYRRFAYLGRWTEQLRERQFGLSN
jgi:curved DNA-binding protein CbpA